MKKVLGILAVSAALVGFTACGGDDSANETGTAAGIFAAQLEEKAAAQGVTVDVDCAIKKLVTLSAEDLTILSDNIESDVEDVTELGASEKAQTVVDQIGEVCLAMDEAASEDMTEETTP
jgi:hypothetical protein